VASLNTTVNCTWCDPCRNSGRGLFNGRHLPACVDIAREPRRKTYPHEVAEWRMTVPDSIDTICPWGMQRANNTNCLLRAISLLVRLWRFGSSSEPGAAPPAMHSSLIYQVFKQLPMAYSSMHPPVNCTHIRPKWPPMSRYSPQRIFGNLRRRWIMKKLPRLGQCGIV
jgi:hypothetical protein